MLIFGAKATPKSEEPERSKTLYFHGETQFEANGFFANSKAPGQFLHDISSRLRLSNSGFFHCPFPGFRTSLE
jgi:hypothetical protein